MKADFEIHPFQSSDYGALAFLQRSTAPAEEHAPSARVIEEGDQRLNPKVYRERWSAWSSGNFVGHAILTQDPVHWHPTRYRMNLQVEPTLRGYGIGSALHQRIQDRLTGLGATSVNCQVHEKSVSGLRFLEARQFKETHRMWQSTCEVGDFDETPYEPLLKGLGENGIELISVRELQNEAGYGEKIHELQRKLHQDIPAPPGEIESPLSLEDFWSAMNQDRGDGSHFLVARRGSEYLGMSFGIPVRESRRFYILLSGVVREARNHGLATALKVRGVVGAREAGCELVSTWNDSRNAPMLALNLKLGFTRRPARIFLRRVLA